MGNRLTCMPSSKSIKNSHSKSRGSARSRAKLEQELERQALALMLYQQQSKSRKFEPRSSSQRFSDPQQQKRRSSSTRTRSMSCDLDFQPELNLEKESLDLSSLETKHFVLVHGGGYGAWCWYKTIALLEECGFTANAIDLTGSGIEFTDPNLITSLSEYSKPLLDYLEKLPVNEKVILVGHDFGGACVSQAMESFPSKISKAVFIAAAMITSSQRALDIFAPELITPDDLLTKAQIFTYRNGESTSPTSLSFEKSLVKDLFFNKSPAKDVALASLSLRPVPFAPVLETINLSEERYGSIRRFYVQTSDDNALTPALQERVVDLNPPEKVFKLKGSDHSPFFSRPQSLHRTLVEIAHL